MDEDPSCYVRGEDHSWLCDLSGNTDERDSPATLQTDGHVYRDGSGELGAYRRRVERVERHAVQRVVGLGFIFHAELDEVGRTIASGKRTCRFGAMQCRPSTQR